MSDRTSRTRQTYDGVASRFLENTRDRSTVARWLDSFAERLGTGARALDLGAGPGCDSAQLRSRGLRVLSLDLSIGMLRAGLPEFSVPRVQGDARQLPLRDGSVAGVWANASLLHLSPDEAVLALQEAARVLCAGGLLHVSVKSGAGAAWEDARYGLPRWFQYWRPADLDAVLLGAGFDIVGSWANTTPRAHWLVRHAVRKREG